MGRILEFILIVIVIFFVWNILKRLFIGTVFKTFQQKTQENNQNKQNSQDPKINQKVNWDAETVEYEEVKDPKDHSQN